MTRKNLASLPRGLKKYIRKRKAQIRKEVLLPQEQEKAIKELYQEVLKLPQAKNKK